MIKPRIRVFSEKLICFVLTVEKSKKINCNIKIKLVIFLRIFGKWNIFIKTANIFKKSLNIFAVKSRLSIFLF